MVNLSGNIEQGFTVHGDLDVSSITVNWFEQISTSSDTSILSTVDSVKMDLSNVERIDSAGLAWLINAKRDAKKYGTALIFNAIPEKLLKLSKISDVEGILKVE